MKAMGVVMLAAATGLGLAQLQGCQMFTTDKTAGEVVDDSVVTARVKTALLADPVVKGTQVQVETYRGVVQLSGFVDKQEDASRAVSIAQGVPGVREVKNDLRMRPRS